MEDVTARLEAERMSDAPATDPAGDATPLIRAIGDPSWRVRREAVRGLVQYGGAEATAALLRTLQVEHRDLGTLNSALEVLSMSRVDVFPALAALMGYSDVDLRIYVTQVIGDMGDARAAPALIQALKDPDANVQYHAIEALGKLRALASVEPLMKMVVSEDFYLAFPAIDALMLMGDSQVAPRLAPLLKNELLRAPIAELLGKLGDDEMVFPLGALLTEPDAPLMVITQALVMLRDRYEDLEIRYAAAIALGRIGDARAVMPLVKTLEKDADLTIVAVGALAKFGNRAAYDALLAMIGHPQPAVRQAVISALNSLGHPQMPADIEILLDEDNPLVRESAVKIAGYFGFANCIVRLLKCASDSVEAVRRAAVEHLPYLEVDEADHHLKKALRHDTPHVRATAARAMAHMDEKKARAPLGAALEDKDPWVRFFAVRSLCRHGYADFKEHLQTMAASDPANQVRIEALKALGCINGEAAVPFLSGFMRDADSDIARAAIEALGEVGPPHAVPALLAALRTTDASLRISVVRALSKSRTREAVDILQWLAASDNDEAVAAQAAEGLAGAAMPEAIMALVNLTVDPARRDKAVGALARLRGEHVDVLAEQLSHPQWQVKNAVIDALTRMKHPNASRYLIQSLDNPEPKVRLAAVRALGKLGNRESREQILSMARNDSDLSVKRAAKKALEKL